MLGIAGAYVLRALAESGSLPKLAVVVTAIAYAGIWLIWAARLPEEALFARTTFATTSALILAPMLWGAYPAIQCVVNLDDGCGVGCVCDVALFLALKHDLESLFWIANVTALLESLGLLMATVTLVPFIWALLIMAMIVEFAAARGRKLGVRALAGIGCRSCNLRVDLYLLRSDKCAFNLQRRYRSFTSRAWHRSAADLCGQRRLPNIHSSSADFSF